MKKNKKITKIEELEEHPINLIYEEKQKLKISNFISITKISHKRKKYYLITSLVILYILIILLFINYSKIKIYMKKREVESNLKYEFLQNIKPSQQIALNNEELNIVKIKREINCYSQKITLSYEHLEYLYKRDKPKISIIIQINNNETDLSPLYGSIFNQSLKDIEIIFIIDFNKDKLINIIEEYMKLDKRIVLIKTDQNKISFYSRHEWIKNAKGKYILFIEPEDLIINNILEKSYITAEKYNLNITQFQTISGNFKIMEISDLNLNIKNGIIYYPNIKDIFYFGKTKNLFDILIRKELLLRAFEFIDIEFIKEDFEINEEEMIFYGLIRFSRSYGYMDQVGYFYNNDKHYSIIKAKFEINNINKIFKSLFMIMRFFYIQSEESRKEKLLVAFQFFYSKIFIYKKYIQYLTEGFDYIIDILDIYLKSTFLVNDEKFFIRLFKSEILEKMLKIKKGK